LQNGKQIIVRGEAKNSIDLTYLYDGCVEFFKKAVELKNAHIIVFFSLGSMKCKKTQKKRQRGEIEQIKKEYPDKQFLIIDNILEIETTLDLKFLSTPVENLDLEFVNSMFRTKSLYVNQVKSGTINSLSILTF
jgi:hypoxanthine-guanine phosphoribosyltransferase